MKKSSFLVLSFIVIVLSTLQITHILNIPGYLLATAALALVLWYRWSNRVSIKS